MNIFKNYKFYVIIISIFCIIVLKICNYIGVETNIELFQDIATYILSALIAYNVITINIPKNKNDIKKDIEEQVNIIQKSKNNLLNKSKSNKKNKTKKDVTQ